MYPHVRTLLRFDTREFLNVLALTFVDVTDDRQALEFQQRIVDVLLKVMVEGGGFSPSQVGSLFTFLARQLARPDNTLFVNRQLFEQVLEFLCTSGDNSRHAERQQALLELLQAGGTSHFEEEYLLGLAEKAQFYHVCEFILERKEQYGSIVLCYLRDHARQEAVFPYIHNLLSLPGYTPAQCAAVRQQTLSHMKDLAEINARKTADLVVDHFGAEILQVLDSLQSSPQLLLHFLESLLEPLGSGQGVRNIGEGPVVAKTYLELLSGEKPTAVLPFLKSCDMYYLEEAIQIVECHSVLDAVSYLLEKKGDAKGAFTVILKVLKKDLQSYVNAQGSVEDSSGQSLSNVESTLMDVVGLCQRNSGKLEEREREGLWFPLLEVMLAQQRKLGPKFSAQVEELKGLTREVINSMAGFIAIPSILLRLLQDPAYSASKFGEVKDLMLTMLDTFNYEKTLLSTTTDLIRHDLHWALSQLRGAAARGLHPRGEACGLCGQAFRQRHGPTGDRKLLVFG
uniref:Uncharacterized protein n=1 Tax=Eptatretus burgeri TaxID=7764 RepID=A0A8C4QHW8_EPTBU